MTNQPNLIKETNVEIKNGDVVIVEDQELLDWVNSVKPKDSEVFFGVDDCLEFDTNHCTFKVTRNELRAYSRYDNQIYDVTVFGFNLTQKNLIYLSNGIAQRFSNKKEKERIRQENLKKQINYTNPPGQQHKRAANR